MSSSLTYRWTYTTTATNPVNALTWTGGQVSKDTTVATSREGTYQVLPPGAVAARDKPPPHPGAMKRHSLISYADAATRVTRACVPLAV